MSRPNYINSIKQLILSVDFGTVFVSTDFTDITDKQTVAITLSRLEEEGLIKRVLRGVYYKPEYNDFLGEYVEPIPDAVAHALARNFGWTIVPCGDTALNLLGLSTQVPAVWIYVSDGTYREYSYGKMTIQFKKTTNKEVSKLSYKTALVVQALKALGKDKVDKSTIVRLNKLLTKEEKKIMLAEAKAATSWIYEFIKEICRG